MLWWISGGIVLLALVVLGVVALTVAGSLRQFSNAALSLQRRLLDGQKRLEPQLERLQANTEAMQPKLQTIQDQQLILQARRGEADGD